ncbi:hypothetical protein L208DRAFT_1381496 [Tricholoma matsutake]|nr:hypothetical protein L208DRAFT_1381496 [Tricholoma matsutake 945]
MSHNILVKAKNFLISGSLELVGEYKKVKEAQDRATENAMFNYNKHHGFAGEIKQYKEQKGEAEWFEGLCKERDDLILHRILFKLYQIEESMEMNSQTVIAKNKGLAGL